MEKVRAELALFSDVILLSVLLNLVFTSDASTGASTSVRALFQVKTNASQAQAEEKEKF